MSYLEVFFWLCVQGSFLLRDDSEAFHINKLTFNDFCLSFFFFLTYEFKELLVLVTTTSYTMVFLLFAFNYLKYCQFLLPSFPLHNHSMVYNFIFVNISLVSLHLNLLLSSFLFFSHIKNSLNKKIVFQL